MGYRSRGEIWRYFGKANLLSGELSGQDTEVEEIYVKTSVNDIDFWRVGQVGYKIISWEEWERESLIIQMDNKRKI